MSSLRDVLYRYKEQFAWALKDAHAGNREAGLRNFSGTFSRMSRFTVSGLMTSGCGRTGRAARVYRIPG